MIATCWNKKKNNVCKLGHFRIFVGTGGLNEYKALSCKNVKETESHKYWYLGERVFESTNWGLDVRYHLHRHKLVCVWLCLLPLSRVSLFSVPSCWGSSCWVSLCLVHYAEWHYVECRGAKEIAFRTNGLDMAVGLSFSREPLLKEKDQYNRPPSTNRIGSAAFSTENVFSFFLNKLS